MNFLSCRSAALAGAAILAAAPMLHAANPRWESVTPKGAPRGSETEFTFHGDRLGDIQEVLAYTPGFAVSEIRPEGEDGKTAKAKVAIPADMPYGEHQFRIRTAGGISDLRTIFVGQFPNFEETEPNSEFDAPQSIPLNHTVEGAVEREDVDYFAIDLKQGQRLSLEIEGMRLGERILDPYIAVLDEKRFELVVADDTPLLAQDAHLSVTAPADGRYIIEVRESSYAADGPCRYRLHVGDFPRPTAVFPAGGRAGQPVEITFLGDAAGTFAETITLPETPQPDFPLFAKRGDWFAPSPNLLRVSAFDNIMESEPNESRNETVAPPQDLPLALNGIIQTAGDEDWFKFRAKKDQKFKVTAYARSLRSPLDSVVNVYKPDGGHLAGNDDNQNFPDSAFDFTAPEDGEYFLHIRDHLRNGGPDYIYRIEVTPFEPSLTLSIPQFDRNDTQQRQMIPVPRGNRYATVINVTRDSFRGDVTISSPDAPAGITLHAELVPDGIGQMPIVFEAAPDAPVSGRLARLEGAAHDSGRDIRGEFYQGLELPRSLNNNKPWRLVENRRLPIAVTEEVPFHIDIEKPAVPIVQNGSMQLKIIARRDEGYDEPITVRMLWNPPGIGSQGTITIGKGETEALYPINADGNAQPKTWKIAVLGEANSPKGPVFASSKLTELTVEPPFLGMSMELATVEQGKGTEVICSVEQLRPFEGAAIVQLQGLPPNTETVEKEIASDAESISFPITTKPDSPTGMHKNLFCTVTVTQNGAPIQATAGQGGSIRIDPPPPPPEEPKPEEKPADQPVAQNQ